MSQTSIITGPERRRSWSDEQKLELLAEAFGPGGSVADVARRADICTSLLYRWRQLMRAAPTPAGFVPAVLNEDMGSPPPAAPGAYGLIDGEAFCLAYVVRGDSVRAISLRRAHEKEMRRHIP